MKRMKTSENHRETTRLSQPGPKPPCRWTAVSTVLLFAFCLFGSTGCRLLYSEPLPPPEPSQPPAYTRSVVSSPECNWGRLRRVVVVPVMSRTVDTFRQNDVAFRVATSIRGIQCGGSEPLDVVLIDPQDCGVSSARGIYNEHQMADLARHYQADAVLYCSLIAYSPHDPIRGELSVAMVDSVESVVLLKAHSRFDLADPETRLDYERYTYEHEPDEFLAKGRLDSPDNFIAYLVDRTMQPLARR